MNVLGIEETLKKMPTSVLSARECGIDLYCFNRKEVWYHRNGKTNLIDHLIIKEKIHEIVDCERNRKYIVPCYNMSGFMRNNIQASFKACVTCFPNSDRFDEKFKFMLKDFDGIYEGSIITCNKYLNGLMHLNDQDFARFSEKSIIFDSDRNINIFFE